MASVFSRRVALGACFAIVGLALNARHASAQDIAPAPLVSSSLGTDAITFTPYVTLPALDSSSASEHEAGLSAASNRRPAALIPLYASLASLQVLDVRSTFAAIDRGAQEANPVVARLLNSPPALMAVKAGSTVAIVYATERLWKRHRVAAVLLMAGLNVGYTGVIARNYSVSRR